MLVSLVFLFFYQLSIVKKVFHLVLALVDRIQRARWPRQLVFVRYVTVLRLAHVPPVLFWVIPSFLFFLGRIFFVLELLYAGEDFGCHVTKLFRVDTSLLQSVNLALVLRENHIHSPARLHFISLLFFVFLLVIAAFSFGFLHYELAVDVEIQFEVG